MSAVQKKISSVDEISKAVSDPIEVLYLSNNFISSLAGIRQFVNVRVLSLGNNDIHDFSELYYLQSLKGLRSLHLAGNSICQFPSYRLHVIANVPSLVSLDGVKVSDSERKAAADSVKREETMLDLIFVNDAMLNKLAHAIKQLTVHAELFQLQFGRVSILNRLAPPVYASHMYRGTVFDTAKFTEMVEYVDTTDPEIRRQTRRAVLKRAMQQWKGVHTRLLGHFCALSEFVQIMCFVRVFRE